VKCIVKVICQKKSVFEITDKNPMMSEDKVRNEWESSIREALSRHIQRIDWSRVCLGVVE